MKLRFICFLLFCIFILPFFSKNASADSILPDLIIEDIVASETIDGFIVKYCNQGGSIPGTPPQLFLRVQSNRVSGIYEISIPLPGECAFEYFDNFRTFNFESNKEYQIDAEIDSFDVLEELSENNNFLSKNVTTNNISSSPTDVQTLENGIDYAIISWKSAVPEPSVIIYGSSSGNIDEMTKQLRDDALTTEHQIRINDLDPDSHFIGRIMYDFKSTVPKIGPSFAVNTKQSISSILKPKPDFVISDIKFLPVKSGEIGELSVVVKNEGVAVYSKTGLEIYHDLALRKFIFNPETPSGSPKMSRPYPSAENPFKNGESITFSWKGNFSLAGSFDVYFSVDKNNLVDEIDNYNTNTVHKVISISDNSSVEVINTSESLCSYYAGIAGCIASGDKKSNIQPINSRVIIPGKNSQDTDQVVLILNNNISDAEKEVIILEDKETKVDNNFVVKYLGTMFLDVENNGRLWYVDPSSRNRFYFSNGKSALEIGSKLALGISDVNISKIPVGVPDKLYNLSDSDNDGLSDRLEAAIGSNPYEVDSDSDGYLDQEEIVSGYSPVGRGKYEYDNGLTKKLDGQFILQVDGLNAHGEIWYVKDGKRWYGGTSDSMYEIMKTKGLGAKEDDIRKIKVGGLLSL